jgi:pSer/pThr/pTyr-binding forkhead associated (FHA) protein
MSSQVEVDVCETDGRHTVHVYNKRTVCPIGRADSSSIQFPDDELHLDISRQHCVLIINPPEITIRDCGSRNGTFVNGTKIGGRPLGTEPEEYDPHVSKTFSLHDNDEVHVGRVVLRIRVRVPEEAAQLT